MSVILVGLAVAALCSLALRHRKVREVDSTGFIMALRRKGWKPKP